MDMANLTLSGNRISDKMQQIVDRCEADKEAQHSHTSYVHQLRHLYLNGKISIEPDDPRTVAGLTKNEVAFIRGEGCEDCGIKCRCDEKFEEAKAKTLMDFAEEEADDTRD